MLEHNYLLYKLKEVMYIRYFKYLLICLCLPFHSYSQQLQVNPNASLEDILQNLVGTGVSISNIEVNCHPSAYGSFTSSSAALGVERGVIMATGRVIDAVGVNNQDDSGTRLLRPGDSQLQQLSGRNTFDACVIEFDVVPTGTELRFDYSFASEEYNEYTCSEFNDIFAFFIRRAGDNISADRNIAVIPGTTNTPVAINTVNGGSRGSFGTLGGQCSLNYSQFFVDNTGGTVTQYDGYTVNLTARAAVSPCQTYHLKLKIADGSDRRLDSGVFIESVSSSNFEVDFAIVNSNIDSLVEGCVKGELIVRRTSNFANQAQVGLVYDGTATRGTDYTAALPSGVSFAPQEREKRFPLEAFADNVDDEGEEIIISLFAGTFDASGNPIVCSGVSSSGSINIPILQNYTSEIESDRDFFCGVPTELRIGRGDSYRWEPDFQISCTDCPNPQVTPTVNTTYTVTVTVGDCQYTRSKSITVLPTNITQLQEDALTICPGDTVLLLATELAPSSDPTTYSWSPTLGLSCSDCPNPEAFPTQTTEYVLRSARGFCAEYDTVTVSINTSAVVDLGQDTILCWNSTRELSTGVANADEYLWSTGETTSTITVSDVGTYWVRVSKGTCSDYDTISLSRSCNSCPFTNLSVTPTTHTLIITDSVQLSASGGVSYQWTPETYLSNSNIANPIASPLNNIVYTVLAVNENGCQASRDVEITIDFETEIVVIPNVFTPNGDNVNDYFSIENIEFFNNTRLQVFNRWGEIVYDEVNYESEWNGTKDGKNIAEGLYYYVLNFFDQGKSFKGTITIIR